MSSAVIDQKTMLFGRLLHYGGLATVLVVGAIAYNTLYLPVERQILETEMEIEELAISGNNAAVIRDQHAQLTGKLHELETRYSALRERVPKNDNLRKFRDQLIDLAHKEHFGINLVQQMESVEGPSYSSITLKLDGKGSFASTCAFFSRLANFQRLSKVKDLSVTIGPHSDEYPVEATIEIYFGLVGERAAPGGEEATRG
jgi:Tfp pilus assembly protein PilO